jgi:hypothetical protein
MCQKIKNKNSMKDPLSKYIEGEKWKIDWRCSNCVTCFGLVLMDNIMMSKLWTWAKFLSELVFKYLCIYSFGGTCADASEN